MQSTLIERLWRGNFTECLFKCKLDICNRTRRARKKIKTPNERTLQALYFYENSNFVACEYTTYHRSQRLWLTLHTYVVSDWIHGTIEKWNTDSFGSKMMWTPGKKKMFQSFNKF